MFLPLSPSPLRWSSQIPFLTPYLLPLSVSWDHVSRMQLSQDGEVQWKPEEESVWPRKVEEPLPQDLQRRAQSLFSLSLLAGMEVQSGEKGWRAQREQPGNICGFLIAERKHADYNKYEPCKGCQRGPFTGGVSRWGGVQGMEVERSAFWIGKKASKALQVPPSAGPGFRNGVGLRHLGGFRNALLLAGAAFI